MARTKQTTRKSSQNKNQDSQNTKKSSQSKTSSTVSKSQKKTIYNTFDPNIPLESYSLKNLRDLATYYNLPNRSQMKSSQQLYTALSKLLSTGSVTLNPKVSGSKVTVYDPKLGPDAYTIKQLRGFVQDLNVPQRSKLHSRTELINALNTFYSQVSPSSRERYLSRLEDFDPSLGIDKYTKDELYNLAKNYDFPARRNMNKDQLWDLLLSAGITSESQEQQKEKPSETSSYDSYTRDQLLALAKERNISGRTRLNKTQLIQKLSSIAPSNVKPSTVNKDLSSLTVKELREKAKEAGLTNYSKLKRDDLLSKLGVNVQKSTQVQSTNQSVTQSTTQTPKLQPITKSSFDYTSLGSCKNTQIPLQVLRDLATTLHLAFDKFTSKEDLCNMITKHHRKYIMNTLKHMLYGGDCSYASTEELLNIAREAGITVDINDNPENICLQLQREYFTRYYVNRAEKNGLTSQQLYDFIQGSRLPNDPAVLKSLARTFGNISPDLLDDQCDLNRLPDSLEFFRSNIWNDLLTKPMIDTSLPNNISVKQPVKSPVKQPVKSPVKQPVKSPVKQPVTSPVRSPRPVSPKDLLQKLEQFDENEEEDVPTPTF